VSCQRNDYRMDLSNGFPITGLVKIFQIDSSKRNNFKNELIYNLDKNITCVLPIISKLEYGKFFGQKRMLCQKFLSKI